MDKGKGMSLHSGLTRKMPVQMAPGDPKLPSRSVDSEATREAVAASPKTLPGRTA